MPSRRCSGPLPSTRRRAAKIIQMWRRTLNSLGTVTATRVATLRRKDCSSARSLPTSSSQGSGHGNVAWALEELAINYRQQSRNAEAEPLAKRAPATYETNNSNRGIARTLNVLARIYGNVGRHQEADELLKRALAINQKMFGEDRASVAGNLANLARSYWNQRRYKTLTLCSNAPSPSTKSSEAESPDGRVDPQLSGNELSRPGTLRRSRAADPAVARNLRADARRAPSRHRLDAGRPGEPVRPQRRPDAGARSRAQSQCRRHRTCG